MRYFFRTFLSFCTSWSVFSLEFPFFLISSSLPMHLLFFPNKFKFTFPCYLFWDILFFIPISPFLKYSSILFVSVSSSSPFPCFSPHRLFLACTFLISLPLPRSLSQYSPILLLILISIIPSFSFRYPLLPLAPSVSYPRVIYFLLHI